MLEAGLLARRDNGSIIPRFRGRLLFPIHDLRGRVVGFGGRLLGPGEPKYLNSPESPIFRKGGTLYNLHQAKNAIRKEEQVILVEGYFDVLRLVLAGAEQVVAPLGTALTPDQAALLRRFTEHAILLLDSDTAGLKATFRAGDELLRHGVRVRVATMPAGEDPDTLVRRGGLAALEPILRDAVDVMERKLQILDRKGWFADIEHRREALDRLLPTIRATRDPIQRELYLTLVAERTGVDKKVLEREAAEEPRRPEPAPNAPARAEGPGGPPTAEPSGEGSRAERSLLTLMLLNADWRERGRESVVPAWFEQPDHRAVYEALLGMDQAGVAAPPETLPDPVRLRWARLLEGVPQLQARDGAGQAALFDGACRILEIRPQFRALDALNDELQLAPEENRAELLGRREALRRDLRARYPVEYQARYGHHRQRRNVMQRHRRPQA